MPSTPSLSQGAAQCGFAPGRAADDQPCPNNGAFDADFVRETIRYEPDSGFFYWARHMGRKCRSGMRAGSINRKGYLIITIKGKLLRAHRLAWLMTYGEWPSLPIDHINGDRADNRIDNLRLATRDINAQNLRNGSRKNKTGFMGVVQVSANTFQAGIEKGGQRIHLGYFSTAEDAHAAYVEAKRLIHPGCTI